MKRLITPTKNRVSRQVSVAAPINGLNARDPLAAMSDKEAVIMDNYFPTPSSVDARLGSLGHATGLGGAVETLMTYNNGFQKEMYAVSSGSIYDVTSTGSVSVPVVSGLSNSRLQSVNFGNVGGHFLMAVNGQDKMQVYDGTDWYVDGTTTSVTGFDTADAIGILNFKNRIWFIERDTASSWYLDVASIGGTANRLDLSGLFRLGGYLMAMANWTIDNAAGIDDYAAFISSEGEVALYKGTDPSSAATWALVGTFRMGRPLGRRCFCKAGADVLVITTDGAFPLSKALLTDRTQMNLAATDKIGPLINADTRAYFNNFGWQPIIHPMGNKLILNVPQLEGVRSIQYVMNTQHGAWCRFTGWDAFCWEVFDDKIYYGSNGVVIEADTGMDDMGSEIGGIVQQAFSYFGAKGVQKLFKLARPTIISEAALVPNIVINVDFRTTSTNNTASTVLAGGSEWDLAEWDVADWAGGNVVTTRWQSIAGVGIAGSLKIATSLRGLGCKWVSTDVVYETGGNL